MKRVLLQSADGGARWARNAGSAAAAKRRFPIAGTAQDARGVLALKQCQDLLKRRLTRSLLDTFRELTGLRLHVWWHVPTAEWQPGDLPELCPRARQFRPGKLPEQCKACFRKRWLCAWKGQKKEKRFAGLCGSVNYCAWTKVQDLRCVTLLVQQQAPVSRADRGPFLRAVHLTRLLLHDLEGTLRAGRGFREPRPATTNPTGGRAPSFPQEPRERRQFADGTPVQRQSRNQQLVRRMLDYIHENYPHPIQLADLAATVHMSPTYVSSLFSTTLGVTFHHYLEQFRLARAKDLLRDPVMRVCEVAEAVGYSNPNHFRNVFTARVGLPPSAWREAATSAGRG